MTAPSPPPFLPFAAQRLDQLIAALQRDIDLPSLKLPDEYFYASLPLCIIDAVFSIGVRYEGTRATVGRWCAFAGWPRLRAEAGPEHSVSDFLSLLQARPVEELAAEAFGNRQRTSSRSGILKAQAVGLFSATLQAHGIERLGQTDDPISMAAVGDEVRMIPGQGSGVSFEYFLMLAGSDEFVKADRMVCRYVGHAVGEQRPVTPHTARVMLAGAAKRLGVAPRALDYAVWSAERERK